jgi:hypothetical protein
VNSTQVEKFLRDTNIIAVFDHSGRAGNGFFLTIFDQHSEVLTCPWVHYIYSYIITEFGEDEDIDSSKAYEFITNKSYFKYVFNDLEGDLASQLIKFGGDPASEVDRDKVRQFFNGRLSRNKTITRRNLILSAYLAYALGVNRDIEQIKYVLVSDAVSLRHENVLKGFSGKVIEAVKKDFDNPKCISLVRDPRANFASNRHQFVNSLGNIYGIRFGNYFLELNHLLLQDLSMHYGCVFLFWTSCFVSAARTIYSYKKKYKQYFITVRNEDLNTKFIDTIKVICGWLNISMLKEWEQRDYMPTMVGKPWGGTGAYNNMYQTNLYGLLQNDPPDVSRKVTGPNVYVTQRWKSRMGENEIKLMEILFREEMADLSYDFLYYKDKKCNGLRFVGNLILPFKGELPTLKWIRNGKNLGPGEVFQRLFYCVSFPSFYILSRIIFMKLYFAGFFDNPEIPLLDHDQNEEKTR